MRRSIPHVLAFCLFASCGDGGPASDLDSGPGDVAVPCATADDCKGLEVGPCETAVCEKSACAVVPAHEGEECEPGDKCAAEPKHCKAGLCEYVAIKECPPVACKVAAGCNGLTGECLYGTGPDGTACDADGNPCTEDACAKGECAAGANGCACETDANCPDNPDRCVPLVCDATKHCVPGSPKECPVPADECTPLVCQPATGTCAPAPKPDDTPCDAGDKCNLGAACKAGACKGVPRCDDHDACTKDTCDPEDGGCLFEGITGTPCDDADACTGPDACDAGVCQGPAVSCDDHNACTADACDHGSGCLHTVLSGETCVHPDPCTVDSTCDADGKCAGTPRDCGDGNPCTDDSCDAGTGECLHVANAAACDDGDVCTTGDACVATVCTGLHAAGCCNLDAECSDGDACTEEACVEHACVFDGEPAYACDQGPGCKAGFCVPDGCADLDLAAPAVLLDWDLAGSALPPGFRWVEVGIVSAGVGTGTFALPARFAPAGVKVLHLFLDSASCIAVAAKVNGGAYVEKDCRLDGGSAVAAYAWTDSAASRIDVEVAVAGGTKVKRMVLFQWAGDTCRPLVPRLVKGGTAFADLSAAGTIDRVFIGYRSTDVVAVASHGLTEANDEQTVGSGVVPYPDRFSTTLLPLPNGGYLLAYGGADKRVKVALLDGQGKLVKDALLAASAGEEQYEPFLWTGTDGVHRMLWSSSTGDSDGLAVVTAPAATSEASLGDVTGRQTVNVDAAGDQHGAVACRAADGAATVAWVSEAAGAYSVRARRLDATGAPQGAADTVVTSSATLHFSHLAAASHQGMCLVAWQTDAGKVGGRWLTADLVDAGDLSFDDGATFRGWPSLLESQSGPLLAYVRSDATGTLVVQSHVGADGTAGAPAALSGAVNKATAFPVVAAAGPFLAAVAYADTESASQGLRLALTSAACANGPVDCTVPASPAVCVGFGATGALSLPGATWCE
jgi:hypothetical protein